MIGSNLLFLIAVVVMLTIGIVLVSTKSAVTLGKILIMIFVTGLTVFGILLGTVMMLFSTVNANYYWPMLVIFGILVIVTTASVLWGWIKKKRVYIPICVIAVICILSTGGFYAYNRYIDSIPTVGETDGYRLLNKYAPYSEDSKVVVLDEPPELTFDENLPKMDGATALYPIYSAFAKAVYPPEWNNDSNNERWDEFVDCTKTSGAYENIVTGDADIIFVAGPSAEQEQFAKDNGVELVYTPIGKEAFVFFVNSKNPIEDITFEQVQKIYSGEITEWSDLGVKGMGEIKAFQREEGSGSQSALLRIMNGKELITPPKEDVISAMDGIIEKTADYKNFKNAIGYSFRFYSTEMVQNNQIKLLSINGIEPTLENIENGTYPIADNFYAVTRSDADENTKKLVEWILGEQGQKIIELTGYTPIN